MHDLSTVKVKQSQKYILMKQKIFWIGLQAYKVKIVILRKYTVRLYKHENCCGVNNWSFMKLTTTWKQSCLKGNKRRFYNKLTCHLCVEKYNYCPFSNENELHSFTLRNTVSLTVRKIILYIKPALTITTSTFCICVSYDPHCKQ
jgi:hypothetical protein